MDEINIRGQRIGIRILATLLFDKVRGDKKIGFEDIVVTMHEALEQVK